MVDKDGWWGSESKNSEVFTQIDDDDDDIKVGFF